MFLASSRLEGVIAHRRVTVVPAGPKEATAYRSPVIAVKGRMFELVAQGLMREGPALWERLIQDDSPATFMHAVEAGGKGVL